MLQNQNEKCFYKPKNLPMEIDLIKFILLAQIKMYLLSRPRRNKWLRSQLVKVSHLQA